MATPRPARVGTLRTAAVTLAEGDGAPADRAARVSHQRRLVAGLCRMLDPQPGNGLGGAGRTGENGGNDTSTGNTDASANGNGHGLALETPLPPAAARLSPRMRQTLERLLAGDSEKQIAAHFGRSRHTVH